MTTEYLKRNALGYEGDTFIHSEIEKLVNKFGINLIIETGSYKGATTKQLSKFCAVTTIEFEYDSFAIAAKLIKSESKHPIKFIHGDSGKVLKNIVTSDKTLYFLDAHWQDAWPLLKELEQIKELGIKPVVVIHDFKVPGKDFGFDSYKGAPLDFEYIKKSIEQIYGETGYDYHYNEQADGAARGVIYVYPKQ